MTANSPSETRKEEFPCHPDKTNSFGVEGPQSSQWVGVWAAVLVSWDSGENVCSPEDDLVLWGRKSLFCFYFIMR